MSLNRLRQSIIDHPINRWARDLEYEPVYTASTSARILIIGQAPGIRAQLSNLPWNDISGRTLRTWMGIDDVTFYNPKTVALVPMDFYYPGKGRSGDLPPRPDFAPLFHPQILRHMPHIQLTLLVGSYAQRYYLGNRAASNLTETVRSFQHYLPDYVPLVHPSPLTFRWRAQNPWFSEKVLPVLQRRVQEVLVTENIHK